MTTNEQKALEACIFELHEKFQELCDVVESLTRLVQINDRRIDWLEKYGPTSSVTGQTGAP